MSDDFNQQARAARRRTRKQMWLVLFVLLLVAIGITGYRSYYANYVTIETPIAWRTGSDWELISREINRGRKMLILVLHVDQRDSEEFAALFENAEIRKQVYLAQLLPVKLTVAGDSEFTDSIKEKFQFDEIPCAVLTRGKKQALILEKQATTDQILETIRLRRGE